VRHDQILFNRKAEYRMKALSIAVDFLIGQLNGR
jgi:hypothetical protein